jgi:hypothetical protein
MIFIVGIVLIYVYREQSYVPKKIWTYWHNPDSIPRVVTKCIETWSKWNPRDEIILLTKKNYKGYVTIPEEIVEHPIFQGNTLRCTDLIQLWTLSEHGGIWIDSSTILRRSLNWVFPSYLPQNKEFSGFYMNAYTHPEKPPVIENWFMACVKGSSFIRLWKDEYSQIARYPSVDVYVKSRIRMGVDPQGINDPIYLAMHIAGQKVLQIDQYAIDTLLLRKAEDGSVYRSKKSPEFLSYMPHMTGPVEYAVKAAWNSEKAVEGLCGSSYDIVVLRDSERKVLEKREDIQACLF